MVCRAGGVNPTDTVEKRNSKSSPSNPLHSDGEGFKVAVFWTPPKLIQEIFPGPFNSPYFSSSVSFNSSAPFGFYFSFNGERLK